MEKFKTAHTNISLLPHDSTVIIKDITQKIVYIDLMKNLLKQFQQAIVFFEKKNLSQFDAQVGETLCQIRAYKVYYLTAYSPQSFLTTLFEVKKNVTQAITRLNTEAQNYQHFLKMHKSQRPDNIRASMTLTAFFLSLECAFSIPEDAFFIFISYFLCQYHLVDNDNIPTAINYSSIAMDMSLSRSYSKKLGHFYQKKLSELSCNFMFELLTELPGKEDLKSILPLFHRQSDEGRMVLPCYPVTEIIVLHMIENKANLMLLMDIETEHNKKRISLLLKGSKSLNNFKLGSQQNDAEEPCIVMYGSSVTHNIGINEILSVGIKEIILSNNAAHPQYSGVILSAFRDNPFKALMDECREQISPLNIEVVTSLSLHLIRMKKLAEKIGCTVNNQSLFLLKHIFCNTINAYNAHDALDQLSAIMPIPQEIHYLPIYA